MRYIEIVPVSIFELGCDQPEVMEEQHKSRGTRLMSSV